MQYTYITQTRANRIAVFIPTRLGSDDPHTDFIVSDVSSGSSSFAEKVYSFLLQYCVMKAKDPVERHTGTKDKAMICQVSR